jgi:hypothetical protein
MLCHACTSPLSRSLVTAKDERIAIEGELS